MLKEKLQKAIEIINRNDRGGFTIPTNKLYPHHGIGICFYCLGYFHLQ